MGIIESINPSTEERYGVLEESSETELAALVQQARADTIWSQMKVEERVQMIERLIPLLETHKQKLALVMAREIGKPITAGRHEVELAIRRIQAYCQLVPGFIADEIVFENEEEQNLVRYEPRGVAAVITPWNAPVFLSFASLIPALLCGNRVLYKPSEYASFTGFEIAELFARLKEAGMPEHTFQLVLGGKEVGERLVQSEIDVVAFTGSVQGGKAVMRNSADKLHALVLELGGKDPALVLEDADLAQAVPALVKAATLYTGQVCFGVERVYCHTKVYDGFVQKCIEELKKIKVGNPELEETEMGPFSVRFQFEHVQRQVQDALAQGALLAYGGKRIGSIGYFMEPGVILEVKQDMAIMKEETFGPLIPIMKFDTDEEAVKLANDSKYGLTASIWTRDIEKGKQLALQVEAGTVEINRHGMSKPGLPWGGYKYSGLGRMYSKEGIHVFTNSKHIWTIKKQ